MDLKREAAWIPALLGGVLLVVVLIDLRQLDAGTIETGNALTREFLVFFTGVMAAFLTLIFAVLAGFQKRWTFVARAAISIAVFIGMALVAAAQGAAFVHATY